MDVFARIINTLLTGLSISSHDETINTDRQTDITKLIVAFHNFRNFANLHKNELGLAKLFPALFLSKLVLDKF
jgi:hypothetical protein